MRMALTLASQGQGYVEPNPMVGCVLVKKDRVVSTGWHRKFGSDHAEIDALREAGADARGATMYVTLEPCCHHGKTPPCSDAVIAAGVHRVVVADYDPFALVDGRGIKQLKEAGIEVVVGILQNEAAQLNAPYHMLVTGKRPWVIAKWAMTLDGKIATRTLNSQWVSSTASRRLVHQLRGRVDAILIGRATAVVDDPQLTARPAGSRQAIRIVADSLAGLSLQSQLVQSAREVPVLVFTGPEASVDNCRQLTAAGCEVFGVNTDNPKDGLNQILEELGRRQITNLLVEGGGEILGSLFDRNWIDEAHVFIAPKLVGGAGAITPISGNGLDSMQIAQQLQEVVVQNLDGDIYVSGRLRRLQ